MKTLRQALRNMRRSPYQALTATLMMTLTFFLIYGFSTVLYGAQLALQFLETRPQVTAFFKVDSTSDQLSQAASTMAQKPYVASIRTLTKEDALKVFQTQNQKDPLLLQLVTADILPASIEVRVKDISDMEKARDDLQANPGVDEVVFQQDVISNLRSWTRTIRIGGISLISLLLVTSMLFIFVIVSLRVAIKRNELSIMNLLGASFWYMRGPFLLEGTLYGFFGSLFGWIVSVTMLLYASPYLIKFFGPMSASMFSPIVLPIFLGVGTLLGVFVGLVASVVAVARVVRHS
ncbi:MAG TPA: permease-like cell division protein FtsX [Patescibacteria group bacterium]|nr:permease-like cell division protein FtsX [Patescibacteria group bacterium]